MYLDKVVTNAKAHATVKVDEQANVHSRLVQVAATVSADINVMSSYRKGQQVQNYLSQAQRGNFVSGNSDHDSNYS